MRTSRFVILPLMLLVAACETGGPTTESGTQPRYDIDLPGFPHASGPVEIHSMNPLQGTGGATVTIDGSGFGATAGGIRVGGLDAIVDSWHDDAISFRVPAGAIPGAADVEVVIDAIPVLAGAFEVVLVRAIYVNEDSYANGVSAFTLGDGGTLTSLGRWATGLAGAGFSGDASSIALHAGTRRLFVSNADGITSFDVDGSTGALGAAKSFNASCVSCFGVAVAPDGSRIFAASFESSSVSVLDVAADGTLAHVPGSPFYVETEGGPDNLQLTADGKFLYVNLEMSQAMEAYSVSTEGVLTRVPGSPFSYGSPNAFVYNLRLDPSSRRLYAPDAGQGRIAVYDLDPSTGVPSLAGEYPAAGTVQAMAFTQCGSRLFVLTDDETRSIHGFSVNAESGALAPLPGSPFASGLEDVGSAAVSGDHLVVLDEWSRKVAVYDLRGASPVQVPGSPFGGIPFGAEPSGLTLSR